MKTLTKTLASANLYHYAKGCRTEGVIKMLALEFDAEVLALRR